MDVSGTEEKSVRLLAIGTFSAAEFEPVDEITNFSVAHPLRPLLTTQRHLSHSEGVKKYAKKTSDFIRACF
jgi:hypothetical protein